MPLQRPAPGGLVFGSLRVSRCSRIVCRSAVNGKRFSKPSFFSKSSFRDVGAADELIAALKDLEITRPSHIQALSFKAYSSHSQSNILIADQAGCGKTLAYLGPIVQEIWKAEKDAGHRITMPRKPRAVVVAPTAELAAQVVSVARSLSRTLPFRCVALTGGRGWRTQKGFLEEGVDVVVGTPQRLLDHVLAETMELDMCKTVVLDEIDILIGTAFDFNETVSELCSHATTGTQFVLVTATIPTHIYEVVEEMFPGIVPVTGPSLHCTTRGATEELVDCSGGDDINEESGQKRKLAALLSLVQQHKVDRTLVFCNKVDTCRKVENFLKRHWKDREMSRVLAHHVAIDPKRRQDNLKDFMRSEGEGPLVLVSTDRASRGLDTASVGHVVLFDFPRDPSEYVRRVGRAARGAWGEGHVSVLVLGRQVPLAQQIMRKSKQGLPVHKVPGSGVRR